MLKLCLKTIMIMALTLITSGVVNASIIASDLITWEFHVESQDKELVSVNYEGNNIFSYEFRFADLSKISPFYNAKATLNYTNIKLQKDESISLKSDLKLNDAGSKQYFTIPEGVTNFKLSVGESSTVIDASADGDTNLDSHHENICQTEDGKIHVAYRGNLDDWYYANSTDNGSTWSTRLLQSTTADYVQMLCKQNSSLITLSVIGNDPRSYESNDNGDTWSYYADILDNQEYFSCVTDSNSQEHCCYIDGTTELVYNNRSLFGNQVLLDTGNFNFCDIEVDDTNNPYIIHTGTTNDDLIIVTRTADGWSTLNEVLIRDDNGLSTSNGDNIDLAIRGNKIVTCDTIAGDLWYCNSTLTNISQWDCTELDATTSYGCSIGITPTGGIEIIYQNIDNINRINSSDGITFNASTIIESDGSRPHLMDSNWPTWNRMGSTVNYNFKLGSVSPDLVFNQYNISSEPPPGVINDCNCSTSGDMVWNTTCTYTVDCVMDGSSDIYCYNNPIITIKGASISGWKKYNLNGCKINLIDGGEFNA